jgi:hypothetical protein
VDRASQAGTSRKPLLFGQTPAKLFVVLQAIGAPERRRRLLKKTQQNQCKSTLLLM